MPEFRAFTAGDAVASAEAALSACRGHAVRIGSTAALGDDARRNLILRAFIMRPGTESEPVIIKATRAASYDPAATDAYTRSGFVKEWAAASLLGRARLACPCAALLATAPASGVLVFEDAGAGRPSLVQPLLHGSAAEAEVALQSYATALARLHTATIGCEAEYDGLVRTAFPTATIPPRAQTWVDRQVQPVLALLGGEIPADELALIAGRLQRPGAWLGLVHGDPCPDNVLLAANGAATLIDFEHSAPGHILLDAAYWRIGFPTCWCAGRVPRAVAGRVDQAYRAALAAAVPEAADDGAFHRESATIAAAWLFGSLSWLLEGALGDEGKWGTSTRRDRILHYLACTVAMLDEAAVLPGVRLSAAGWLTQLRARWPGSTPLAVYPAFAASGDAL